MQLVGFYYKKRRIIKKEFNVWLHSITLPVKKITVIFRTVDLMYQICPKGSVLITSKQHGRMLQLKDLLKWFGIACKAGW